METKLASPEVPFAFVDFLEKDPNIEITGKQKLALLDYLSLEETLQQVGSQRFDRETVDCIEIGPVRDWFVQHYGHEFACDLGSGSLPLTFRASLALALFKQRIMNYLSKIGDIEVYASAEVQKAYKRCDLSIPEGMSHVDYNSLPDELKKALILPLMNDLSRATIIAKAGLLFPDGMSKVAAIISDPTLLGYSACISGSAIYFNEIVNLEVQAAFAETGIHNYDLIMSVPICDAGASEAAEPKRATAEDFERMMLSQGGYVKCDVCGELEKEASFEPGTTLFDIVRSRGEVSNEDIFRSFNRISDRGFYSGKADEWTETFRIQLREDGSLHGYWNYNYCGAECDDAVFDMLRPAEEPDNEHLRRINLFRFIDALCEDIDAHEEAVQRANQKYGRTEFVIEENFFEALTSKRSQPAKSEQVLRSKKLIKEIHRSLGVYEDVVADEVDEQCAAPVDLAALHLDMRVLNAIKESFSASLGDIFSLVAGGLERNNIAEWARANAEVIGQYIGIMVNDDSLFRVLGIKPTNDEKQITEAYRRIARKTHPDVVLQLPADERIKAAERFMQATYARNNLMARLGSHNISALSPTYYLGRISELFRQEDL